MKIQHGWSGIEEVEQAERSTGGCFDRASGESESLAANRSGECYFIRGEEDA